MYNALNATSSSCIFYSFADRLLTKNDKVAYLMKHKSVTLFYRPTWPLPHYQDTPLEAD